jgi:hypothetical protein
MKNKNSFILQNIYLNKIKFIILFIMEYEIYYLCNLLGVFLVVAIVLFHFVDADKNLKNMDAQASKESRKNVNLNN